MTDKPKFNSREETQAIRTGRGPSSRPGSGGERFPSGTLVAGRYRIIKALGQGGMGEVVQAEDQSLQQTIALKFLPTLLASDGHSLDRLREEVRMARRVSHPKVSRVHDLGEMNGQCFITMEYVDGEDMATLLRRVGRLAGDRALVIARELCAGLAAAHAAGVVHRDLKPANVMLDRAGRVRITDFGLALPREDEGSAREFAGTPAYMAPEQLADLGATERSDLYALGLVLYELFTGRRAFPEAGTLSELIRVRSETTLVPPAQVVRDMDPVVEQAVLHCLSIHPEQRPESALDVLTELSGGDPLKAALAAGQTPSPSAVATAKVVGALSPLWAWIFVGVVLAVIVASSLWLNPRFSAVERLRPPYPPEVLAVKAEEALRALGPGKTWADTASGFAYDDGALRSAASLSADPAKRAEAAAAERRTIVFWYRCSPVPLEPSDMAVTQGDPPIGPGETLTILDTEGRLLRYEHFLDVGEGSPGNTDSVKQFLRNAGLEAVSEASTSLQQGHLSLDVRLDGTVPAKVEVELQGGRLVSAAVIRPWTPPDKPRTRRPFGPSGLMYFSFHLVSLFLAYRNLRARRGDVKGATRIGLMVFGCSFLGAVLKAHYTGTLSRELYVLQDASAWALYDGATTAAVYLALEPFVRRVWPQSLVSWTRLLAGRVRDPMVARDVLLALAAFLGAGGLVELGRLMVSTKVPFIPAKYDLAPLLGSRHCVAAVIRSLEGAISTGLIFLLLLLLLNPLRRVRGLAPGLFVGVVGGLLLAPLLFMGWPVLFSVFMALLVAVMFFLLLTRLGLLSMVVALFFTVLGVRFPNTTSLTGWTAYTVWWPFGIMFLGVAYGLYFSTGGRPFGGRSLLEG